jgi:hypothetical protein
VLDDEVTREDAKLLGDEGSHQGSLGLLTSRPMRRLTVGDGSVARSRAIRFCRWPVSHCAHGYLL